MAAFVTSEVEILDERAAIDYRQLAAASIEVYGGRYLVRAAEALVAEGQDTPEKMVIVESPSIQSIQAWDSSPEYAESLKFRNKALRRRLIFVEGVGKQSS